MKTPEDFCIFKYDRKKFEETGVLDCFEDVDISRRNLTEIPFQFGVINGSFCCSNNLLKSLKKCPTEVIGNFDCSVNDITSLEYSPKKIKGFFHCYFNQLTDLHHSPSEVDGTFDCRHNKLKTFKGAPAQIKEHLDCRNNELTSLEFIPQGVKTIISTHKGPKTIVLTNNGFDVKEWISVLKKYSYTFRYCNLVPDNSSLKTTLKGLKDKLEIIRMMEGV
jgi:hypothetical protein